jgi:ABC-type amino acid transport substrate-binding protein
MRTIAQLAMRALRLLPVAALIAACGVPRDPDDTLERVQGGVMRVGVAINEPWTADSAGTPVGVEPALVRALARELRAQVSWVRGGESVLIPQLHERKLDLVVGGLDAKTAWSKSFGMTMPYYTVRYPEKRQMVWAVAPGENAWQMRVERFLLANGPAIERTMDRAAEAQRQ